jgi:aminoglycoside phosphotransferase (APT) family kinase protein
MSVSVPVDSRAAILAWLRAEGLASAAEPPMEPLAGGVSSDIWRVDLPSGAICVKRALPQLKTAQEWKAPIERNAYEWAWIETVSTFLPAAVPKLVAHDTAAGMFAMEYLDPATHPLWKAQLRDGLADEGTARTVGERLVAIHAHTAGDPQVRARFQTDAFFHALRVEPYLLATAARHPDLKDALERLARTTAGTHLCLVHGDVSPKNILVGPGGPVFLDAECAWYGDPAFDLAFCLNHLLLKCLWRPVSAPAFFACFDALTRSYVQDVTWEPRDAIERRTARLLPGLFLARVDGKSPVEYLTRDEDRERVRRVGRSLLATPVDTLAGVRGAWARELGL